MTGLIDEFLAEDRAMREQAERTRTAREEGPMKIGTVVLCSVRGLPKSLVITDVITS